MTHRGYVCFDSFRHAFGYSSFPCVKMPSQYCANLCAVNFGIQDLSVQLCGPWNFKQRNMRRIWHSDIVCCDTGKCSDRRIYRISAK